MIGKNTTDIGELRNDVGEDLPAPGSLRYSVNKNAEAIGTLRYDVGKTLAPLPGSLLFRVGENEGAITSLEATVGSGPTDSDTLSFWVDYLRRNLSESLLPTINSIRNFVGWETGLQPGTLGYQVNEHDEAIVRHEATITIVGGFREPPPSGSLRDSVNKNVDATAANVQSIGLNTSAITDNRGSLSDTTMALKEIMETLNTITNALKGAGIKI